MVGSDGGVFACGDAGFFGSAGGIHLNAAVVGMAATPDGQGYVVGSDGGVFAYGDAGFHGYRRPCPNAPVVGMASTPDGQGYWLVAADGGVFAYGDAGSTARRRLHLNAPVVGIAPTLDGHGYWMVASDGGVFAYGDAGSRLRGRPRPQRSPGGDGVGPDGGGYWVVGSDGGVFTFGDAGFFGSPAGGRAPTTRTAGITGTPGGTGYWLVTAEGSIATFGDARYFGTQRETIALYGDSLGMQAAPFLQYLAGVSGDSTLLRAYNGWAICDDLQAMASDAATLHPSVALIEFSGNAVTHCMSGYTMGTTAYYDKYEADTQQAIDIFRNSGIPVVLIGAPISAWANLAANLDFLNQIYASLAAANPGVTYVDAGQSVLANGKFTLTLPCLPFEPCTGPAGTNVVRSPDGVHFCPDGNTTVQGWYSLCDVYSSGGFPVCARHAGPPVGAVTG